MIDMTRESLSEATLADANWDAIRNNLREYLPETRSPERHPGS